MAGAKKPRKARVHAIAQPPIAVPEVRELKAFYDGAGQFDDFAFARFYWEAGEGERESIVSKIDKKLHPVRSASGDPVASAAKVDLLLPAESPQDYMSLDHLIRRYEEMLPAHEVNAYAQVTLRFPKAVNLHQPWEMARTWARSFYERVPVVLILHAPHLWGSANPGHVHCLAFARRASAMGWGEMERRVASDAGQQEAYDSWTSFKDQWPDHTTSGG